MAWKNFVDILYPIKGYYITTSTESPANLFGGQWEKIEGGLCITSIGNYSWTTEDLYSGAKLASSGGTIGGSDIIDYSQLPKHDGHLASWGGNCTLYLPQGKLTAYGSTGRGWDIQAGNEAVPAKTNKGNSASYIPKHYGVYVWRKVG